MNLSIPKIPSEVDADVAMSVVIPYARSVNENRAVFSYDFLGVSRRTAQGDKLHLRTFKRNNKVHIDFSLNRDSLYHILPEALFHPLDHYLGVENDSDEFDRLYRIQEEQKKNALNYFKPFDTAFQELMVSFQMWMNDNVFSDSRFLVRFYTEGMTLNEDNPLISNVLPCIPWLRDYRGNDEMIITSLKRVFGPETVIEKRLVRVREIMPDTISSSLGKTLGHVFCGPAFKARKESWNVHVQLVIDTEEHLRVLKKQVEEFSVFFKRCFLSVESSLQIDFKDENALPVLRRHGRGIFLNYSTQML